MKRLRHGGFSLVELMIAILLAAITGVVVLNVLTSYQSRSNTMTGRNDAEIGAAISLYAVEKEVRMGGAGLTTTRGPLCPLGVNIFYDTAVNSNGVPLLPVRIIDGGAGPDAIEVIRSDSDFGGAPTRLVAAMANPTSQLSVDGRAGLNSGDLVMLGASDGTKLCTLMQLSDAPAVNGSGWLLSHASGGTNLYNPADPTAVFTTAVSYDVRDMIMNMGTYGVRRYGLVCNTGTVAVATNNCDLASWNPLRPAAAVLGNVDSIAPQIVDLQAQYGISPAGNNPTVNQWVDATAASGWDAPTLINQQRIKAVRIAIVARGAREGSSVAPASVTLWQNDPNDASLGVTSRSFDTAEQRYRYQVLTVVVPLINTIWTGT
jgi:type IV pilus assembly protein PilW